MSKYSVPIVMGLSLIQSVSAHSMWMAAESVSVAESHELRIPCPSGEDHKWVPGLHFNVLMPGMDGVLPENLEPGQVELLELNHYRAGESMVLNPAFQSWLGRHSGKVKFTYRPLTDSPHKQLQAQMYFALEELGRLDLHAKLRVWILDKNERTRYWTYENHWFPNERATFRYNLEFAVKNGVTEHQFTEVYRSERISDKVRHAGILTRNSVVNGGPTYVVNRRYSTSRARIAQSRGQSKTQDDSATLVELLDYLVGAELQKHYLSANDLDGRAWSNAVVKKCRKSMH